MKIVSQKQKQILNRRYYLNINTKNICYRLCVKTKVYFVTRVAIQTATF